MSLSKDKRKVANKGFEQLLGVHTAALEENSQSLVEILQLLSEKNLSVKDKNSLKRISKELKAVDKKIDAGICQNLFLPSQPAGEVSAHNCSQKGNAQTNQ